MRICGFEQQEAGNCFGHGQRVCGCGNEAAAERVTDQVKAQRGSSGLDAEDRLKYAGPTDDSRTILHGVVGEQVGKAASCGGNAVDNPAQAKCVATRAGGKRKCWKDRGR